MRLYSVILRGPSGHTLDVVAINNRGAAGYRCSIAGRDSVTFYDERLAAQYILRSIHEELSVAREDELLILLSRLDAIDYL